MSMPSVISSGLNLVAWIFLMVGFINVKKMKPMAIGAGVAMLIASFTTGHFYANLNSILSRVTPVGKILLGVSYDAEGDPKDMKDHLEFLKDSLDQGLFSKEEYEKMKKEYLDE